MNIEELSIRLRIVTINRELYEKMELERQKLDTIGSMAMVMNGICFGNEDGIKASLGCTYACLVTGNYIDGYWEKGVSIVDIYNKKMRKMYNPIYKASVEACKKDRLIKNFTKATNLILDEGYSEGALEEAIGAIIECAVHYYIDLEGAIEKAYYFIQKDTEEMTLRKMAKNSKPARKEGVIFGD